MLAVSAFDFPTFSFLNKNYLLRLEVSILSSSVTVTNPSVDNPIRANIFKNSHPKAPAPTKKTLEQIEGKDSYLL